MDVIGVQEGLWVGVSMGVCGCICYHILVIVFTIMSMLTKRLD